MVRKKKAVIDSFHKWVDAYTMFMHVLVTAYPRRAVEFIKYLQIISKAEAKFRGLAWLHYDEQFRCHASQYLTLNFFQVKLSLTVSCVPVPTTVKRTALLLTPPGAQPGALAQPATPSINQWVALVGPASSSMCAADAAPSRIPSCTANLDNLRPRPSSPATVAKSKVLQRSRSQQPSVSTPINIDVLEHKLLPHPDRTFVNYLLNSLRFGTHIGYTGPIYFRFPTP